MNHSKWKTQELSKAYLEGVRGAIPCADTQLEIMLKIVRIWNPHISSVMDLGCGDGILGRTIMAAFPSVQAFFADFSDHMLDAAKKKLGSARSASFFKSDLSSPNWKTSFNTTERFDLIVSGFSIHHQSDQRKKELYGEIYEILNAGGIFLNLEHVASSTHEVEKIFNDYFIDHLHAFHKKKNPDTNRDVIADEFYNRPDKGENILAPVDIQCGWLREIGYQDVDCFFKSFELALFGGRKMI